LHESWTEAGTRREAYYADLSPGEYTFEVMACNHHGVWPDRGTTVGLHLAPFFYQTWWFYVCCGTALAGFAMLGVNWRIREIRKIHELERANALSEQRRRIARDVHDDLGASLTHILQLAADNPKDGSAVESSRRSARIAAIAEEAVDDIGEIVWANNPEFDTLPDLVAYIREYAAKFLDAAGIAVQFDFPDEVPSLEVNGLFRRHLLLVLKESLRNIAQHAKASEVRIQLVVSPAHLKLEIADNGCGLKAQNRPRTGNGLANMRQRIAELNGSFTAASLPGQGTRIQALVPWSIL
jgi:signal transduction histidine kinase